jgi:hypothetical protein
MSDWPTQQPMPEPTQDEMVQAAYRMGYESGVKDGAERADQWASNRLNMTEGDAAAAWVMKLLPTSPDVLAKRLRDH